MEKIAITAYCHIKNNSVWLNGERVFSENSETAFRAFLKSVYRHLGLKYAKFFKMDEISKLGFLAAELLLKNADKQRFTENKVGVVFSNSQSTLVTDSLHQESINDYSNFYPSPSVFVYTLPNIMIGEISIRHQFRGENAFFIFEHFNFGFVTDYVNKLIKDGKISACLCGWVDQSASDYEAFLYWTEKKPDIENMVEHNSEQLKKLYEKN